MQSGPLRGVPDDASRPDVDETGSGGARAVGRRFLEELVQTASRAMATKPEPTKPEPTEPEPTKPEPTKPAPAPVNHEGARRAAPADSRRRSWRQILLDLVVHRRPKYSTVRGDIEGLRAIAVVWVLLYHLGVPGVRGGFVGVDVFLVISGFLITGQLLAMVKRTGRLDLADFWSRRIRRLMPAATLVIASTVLLGRWLLPASEWDRLGTDATLSSVYVLNWGLAARSVDYLAEDAAASPLQHYWSLGVEEQFYLLWPLTIIICLLIARRWSGRRLGTITAGLAVITVASFAYSAWYTGQEPGKAYFSTFTRLWELAVGALIACALTPIRRHLPRRLVVPLAAIGVAAVVASAFVIKPTDAWPGVLAWLPVAGAGLVIAVGTVDPENRVARLLGNTVMRQIGMLSYSLYLWHWPLIAIWSLRHPDAGWLSKIVIAILAVVLAMLTLALVEDPIRFSGLLHRHSGRAFALAAVLLATTVTLGQVVRAQAPTVTQVDVLGPSSGASASAVGPSAASSSATPSGTPSPTPKPVTGDYLGALSLIFNSSVTGVPTLRTDLATASTVTKTVVPDPAAAAKDLPSVYSTGCQRSKDETKPVRADQCLGGDVQGTIKVAIVGDSKADQWEPALRIIGSRHGWRVQSLAKSGCTFGSGTQYPQCDEYNKALLAQLLASPPDLLITSTYAENQGTMAAGMADYLGQLQAKGTKVIFLADNPTPPTAESVYQCVERTGAMPACEFPRNDGHGTGDITTAAQQLGAPVIDMNDWICPPSLSQCPVVLGNVFLYRQSSHLTMTFVTSTTPILERKLVEDGILDRAVLPLQPGG